MMESSSLLWNSIAELSCSADETPAQLNSSVDFSHLISSPAATSENLRSDPSKSTQIMPYDTGSVSAAEHLPMRSDIYNLCALSDDDSYYHSPQQAIDATSSGDWLYEFQIPEESFDAFTGILNTSANIQQCLSNNPAHDRHGTSPVVGEGQSAQNTATISDDHEDDYVEASSLHSAYAQQAGAPQPSEEPPPKMLRSGGRKAKQQTPGLTGETTPNLVPWHAFHGTNGHYVNNHIGDLSLSRRRQKNRAAAAKCRYKTRRTTQVLEEMERNLSSYNELLRKESERLREEVLTLNWSVLSHGTIRDDEVIRGYIKNKAENLYRTRA